MSHKLILWIFGILIIIIALSGRILRVEGAALPDGAQISVASTLQAIFTPQATSTASPSLLPITGWVTPTSLSTTIAIPPSSIPVLTLKDATNCRTGPGQAYELIVTYPINQRLEIAGRYGEENFWLVKLAESPTGTCWLWGEYAEVDGSYPAVNLVTPPPTLALPRPPTLHQYTYDCDDSNNTLSFNLIWNDKAENESGYRIFRDGAQIAELPASSSAFAETISIPASRSVQYYVQAYNEIGSADGSFVNLTCN